MMLRLLVPAVLWFCFSTVAAGQTWTDVTPASGAQPLPRRSASATYDPVDHRMIVFGGRAAPADANDIWAFDLASHLWTELTPPAGPAPGGRFEADMIYDPVTHRVIVYNGQGLFQFFNDVWAFDLTTNTWTELLPPGPLPAVRYGSGAVFDPQARDLVTFAGFTNQGRFKDTWRFDVDGVQWTDVSPAQDPGRRCLHAACYDPFSHRMLSYGGQRFGPLGDLWSLDLATDTWTELTPANSPPGRFFPVAVFDTLHRRALVFGGQTDTGRQNQTWAYWTQLGTWELLRPAGPLPSPRQGAAAVFVPGENRMVTFGGTDGALLNDVWSLDLGPRDPLAVRAGNVNAASGPVTDVLLVNGSAGSTQERRVETTPVSPFEIRMDAPPAEPGPVEFALYGWSGAPDASTARALPRRFGYIGMPIPLVGGEPAPGVIWNSLGATPFLGVATRPSPLAPAVLFRSVPGLRVTGDFYLQGFIRDRGALRGGVAITNGVWILSR